MLSVGYPRRLTAELTAPQKSDVWAPLIRQREYAVRVASGLTNSAIAAELCLTTGAVNNMLVAILHKLGLKSRLQGARWITGHAVRGRR
jgi:DNA-binding NarL/FixJ family response regulator